MKIPFIFALGGALCISSHVAVAAPAPKLAPATFCAPDTDGVDLMEMYLRLPDYVFRYFTGYNTIRTKLLEGQDVIYDKGKSYIEIPYAGRSNPAYKDKLYNWQMTSFRDTNYSPVLVVSSTVEGGQTKVKPFIHVFRFDRYGYPYRTTAKDFPYKISYSTYKGKSYANSFFLPRSGNKIIVGMPATDQNYFGYRWTGSKFVPHTDKTEYGG